MADAGRVIAGSARGVRLAAPGEGTRPLTDRVKQTLFAILEPELEGARVLDLFAGSGAAGIEALSRGAAHATFVERDRAAVRTIETNLERARLSDRATIERVGRCPLLPFATRARTASMSSCSTRRTRTRRRDRDAGSASGPPDAPLGEHARVIAKHFWRSAPPATVGLLASERERRFGETALTFYRRTDGGRGA